MPLYVYSCPDGHRTEALRGGDVATLTCRCGKTARRESVYRMAIGGRARPPVSERQVNFGQFREATEELAYNHAKAEESAQQTLPPPDLWKTAKKRAAKLMAAGVTDSLDYHPEHIRD